MLGVHGVVVHKLVEGAHRPEQHHVQPMFRIVKYNGVQEIVIPTNVLKVRYLIKG